MLTKEIYIIKVCSNCEGPFTSLYGRAGKCMTCGCKGFMLSNIASQMLDRDYLNMKYVEEKLGNDFRKIIRSYNKVGVMLRRKRMKAFTNALRWMRTGKGLKNIRDNHTMANICIKDKTPIPREDAYELFRDCYNGLHDTHWTRYQAKRNK